MRVQPAIARRLYRPDQRHRQKEGQTVNLVNLEGSAIFGPGSQWFWSMAQFILVAVTLIGIYYQLRLA